MNTTFSLTQRLGWGLLGLLVSLNASATDIQKTRLSNGLTVITHSVNRSPTVASTLWYRVGSMDEEPGKTGLAHVLEHMMFKATASLKSGEFSKKVQQLGGRDNAFTSADQTVYFQMLPKEGLSQALKMEASRMHSLKFDATEFAKELAVVKEERRMRTEDSARALLGERLGAQLYLAHPYRFPIIGWMEDLERLSVTDAEAFYRRWYGPNNATLIVVGDVSHAEVLRLARRHFGPLRPIKLPTPRLPVEPQAPMHIEVEVAAPAEKPYALISYPAPNYQRGNEAKAAGLLLLAQVLDGSEFARLGKALLRSGKALEIHTSYDSLARGPRQFSLGGAPAAGTSGRELLAAFEQQLQELAQNPPSALELERAKNQFLAHKVFQQDSLFAQALELGEYHINGFEPSEINAFYQHIERVKPEDVQAAAASLLASTRSSRGFLKPLPLDQAKPRTSSVPLRH